MWSHFPSVMRSAIDSAENPPKITRWTAPMRAHASMAIGSSMIIGMYMATRSPFRMPLARSRFANLHT